MAAELPPGVDLIALNQRAVALYNEGHFEDALPVALEFRAAAERELPESDPAVSRAHTVLGGIFVRLGRLEEAKVSLHRALELRSQYANGLDPSMVPVLTGLADWAHAAGDRHAARGYYLTALEIRARNKERGDPERAGLFRQLWLCYAERGDIARADEYFDAFVDDKRPRLDSRDDVLELALALAHYASTIAEATGRYALAEAHLHEALHLLEQVGLQHSEAAGQFWANLGSVYHSRNDLPRASEAYQRAVDLRVALGDLRSSGRIQNNRAGLLRRMGQHFEALLAYTVALELSRKSGDVENELNVLANLGGLHRDLRQHEKAVEYYRQSLDRQEDPLGRATTMQNMASSLDELGRLEEARELYEAAIAVLDTLGPEFQHHAINPLINLGRVLAAQGAIRDALARFNRAAAIHDAMLAANLGAGSDRQRLALLEELPKRSFEPHLTLIANHLRDDAAAVRSAFELTLRRKSVATDIAADILRVAHRDRDLRAAELASVAAELARLQLEVGADGEPIPRLERRAEELEAGIASQARLAGIDAGLWRVETKSVSEALPKSSALIELIRYAPARFGARVAAPSRARSTPRSRRPERLGRIRLYR